MGQRAGRSGQVVGVGDAVGDAVGERCSECAALSAAYGGTCIWCACAGV